MQLRREPHLGVHHAVSGQIDGGLVGNPLDRVCGLHHGERVLEGRQVLQQVAGLGAAGEPRLQIVRVGRRQRPTDRVRELEDGRHAQTAVEMIVQEHLGQLPGLFDRDGHRRSSGRAPYCIPLNQGMPSSAGGLRRCAPIDTAISVTTYGVTNTSWLFGDCATKYAHSVTAANTATVPAGA